MSGDQPPQTNETADQTTDTPNDQPEPPGDGTNQPPNETSNTSKGDQPTEPEPPGDGHTNPTDTAPINGDQPTEPEPPGDGTDQPTAEAPDILHPPPEQPATDYTQPETTGTGEATPPANRNGRHLDKGTTQATGERDDRAGEDDGSERQPQQPEVEEQHSPEEAKSSNTDLHRKDTSGPLEVLETEPNDHFIDAVHRESSTALGSDDAVNINARRSEEDAPTNFDLILHGSRDGSVEYAGEELSSQDLIDLIKTNPNYDDGQIVRLAICHAANGDHPQAIANGTGSHVVAANDMVRLNPNGSGSLETRGQLMIFKPEHKRA